MNRSKKKVEEKKELVIPLIRENRWKFEEKSSAEGGGNDRRKESERKRVDSQEPVSSTVDEPISEEEALRRRALSELLGKLRYQICLTFRSISVTAAPI